MLTLNIFPVSYVGYNLSVAVKFSRQGFPLSKLLASGRVTEYSDMYSSNQEIVHFAPITWNRPSKQTWQNKTYAVGSRRPRKERAGKSKAKNVSQVIFSNMPNIGPGLYQILTYVTRSNNKSWRSRSKRYRSLTLSPLTQTLHVFYHSKLWSLCEVFTRSLFSYSSRIRRERPSYSILSTTFSKFSNNVQKEIDEFL